MHEHLQKLMVGLHAHILTSYIHTNTYTYIHTYIHNIHTSAHIQTNMHTNTSRYICIYIQTHVHIKRRYYKPHKHLQIYT